MKQRRDGRSTDLSFNWIEKTLGRDWADWRTKAEVWMKTQETNLSHKLSAFSSFFKNYLSVKAPYATDIHLFMTGYNGHLCSSEEFLSVLKETVSDPKSLATHVNIISSFVDWIIQENSTKQKDGSSHLYKNPLNKIKQTQSTTETVRTPLPYKYIKALRKILCPQDNGSFSDWRWAHQSGLSENSLYGDWYEVDSRLIDKNDPDCVWRTIEVVRRLEGQDKIVTVFQLWSPAKAMLIFIKLHIPLRTYQVRMLDSGEADTWRYCSGNWVINQKHNFSLGTQKRPCSNGVFKRIHDRMLDSFSTGLYINTNKTADQNKSSIDKGYVIPWEHKEVLYWLEKFRDWQDKYNPIDQPTACTYLKTKHTGTVKSKTVLNQMGAKCFLFRNPCGKGIDRHLPITDSGIGEFWYRLLLYFEEKVNAERLKSAEPLLQFVTKYPKTTKMHARSSTLFPLHSLRVSLITSYTMDTNLPLPVISKLLAGHSRLYMTIYYNKITPAVMADKMQQAHGKLDASEDESLALFIKNAADEQIKIKTVYHDQESILAGTKNRNLVGWEERPHGLCLAGGNTTRSEEPATLAGCWNGGELIQSASAAQNRRYATVPHGPENCIRCRWFITDARYLPKLVAYFNQIAYKASQAASLALELESEKSTLEDELYFSQQNDLPFNKFEHLKSLEQRYNKQISEADEFVKDWIASFNLIARIMQLEEKRSEDDTKDKLIAVGDKESVTYGLQFIETHSELFYLSLLCQDAEIYPSLEDELRKTPAIHKRTMSISRALMKGGFQPILMEMDDHQQLIVTNAMLRSMVKLANIGTPIEGYQKVSGYLEGEEFFKDNKLLIAGVNELAKYQPTPIAYTRKKELTRNEI